MLQYDWTKSEATRLFAQSAVEFVAELTKEKVLSIRLLYVCVCLKN